MFDQARSGRLKLIQIRITLALLCSVEAEDTKEKQKLLFNEACTMFGGGFMTELDRTGLIQLFSIMLRLTEILDEGNTFGVGRAEVCASNLQ